jgi:acyl-coenzyme A thioesterase 13
MSDDAKKKALAERVKQASSAGFGATCGFRHISFDAGKAIVELDIGPAVQNMGGFLHGGAIATMVDDAGTLAIITADRDNRPGVTTDLNVSYFAPAPGGSTVVAEATVLKIGKTLAFVTVDIRRKADGVLVAQGRMTKFQG